MSGNELFSMLMTPENMLRVLDGDKTVTRRVCGLPDLSERGRGFNLVTVNDEGATWVDVPVGSGMLGEVWCKKNRYGKVGDVFVPKTTWAVGAEFDGVKPSELPADVERFWFYGQGGQVEKPAWAGKKRPGRFLPKFLWGRMPQLVRTAMVEVERLQDITQGDVLAEGVGMPFDGLTRRFDPVASVMLHLELLRNWVGLWDGINGGRGYGWDKNPFVWVVRFGLLAGHE